ncbi:MAG: ABC transporter permease [Candidatus Latescibacteria bacterium]|nr:ABC transporter permease [Candidatus Latescibacterota bacterium]
MHFLLSYLYEFRHQKLRMFLTIMAVSWGMANIALMLSVGEGLYQMMSRGMTGMGEGIVVMWPNQTSMTHNGFGPGKPVRVTEQDIHEGEKLPLVKAISAEYSGWSVQMKTADKNISKQVRGVYPCYGVMRNLIPERGGRFLNTLDEERRRRVIFIGNEIRNTLFGEESNPVGKTIWVNGSPFTVIGVMEKKFQTSMYSGSDAQASFIPASTFRTLFNRTYVNIVLLAPESKENSKDAQEAFRSLIAARHRFHPDDKELFHNWDTFETQEMQDKIFRGLQLFLGIIGGLTLLIAGLGVANIMYVTVKERTREIGIKMAVGAHPLLIIMQFLLEALFTVSIGGALGVAMSMGLMALFDLVPLPETFINVMGRPEPVFSGLIALVCVTILNFVGLMAGIFPARRASLVDPVDALRYE